MIKESLIGENYHTYLSFVKGFLPGGDNIKHKCSQFLAHIATLTSYDLNCALAGSYILCADYRFIVDNSLEAT